MFWDLSLVWSLQVSQPRHHWCHWPGWSPPTRRSCETPVTTSYPCPTRPWLPRCCGTSSPSEPGPWPLRSLPPSSSCILEYSLLATGASRLSWYVWSAMFLWVELKPLQLWRLIYRCAQVDDTNKIFENKGPVCSHTFIFSIIRFWSAETKKEINHVHMGQDVRTL